MLGRILIAGGIYCAAVSALSWYCGIFTEKETGVESAGREEAGRKSQRTFLWELVIIATSLYCYLYLTIIAPFGDAPDFEKMLKTLNEGFYGIYQNGGITYPPLFQYLFFLWGKVIGLFGIPIDATKPAFSFCVKLPCIVCVFFMAYLVYQIAVCYVAERKRLLVLFLVLWNPGFLFVTGYVCQVDALYVFFMLLTVFLMMKGRLKSSYFTFAMAVLCKFQAVFITPVIAFAVIDQVILKDFSWKRFFEHLAAGLTAIACMGLSYLPFSFRISTGEITEGGFGSNFAGTIAGFGKASQNAYNFWTLVGYNEIPQTEKLGSVTCQTWSSIFLVALVGLSVFFYIRRKHDVSIYPMLAALLVSGTFCFAVRMMSRYLYAAPMLLFLGYACRPTKKRLLCAVLMNVSFFLGTTVEYLVYPWREYEKGMIVPAVLSAFSIFCFGFLIYTIGSEKCDDRYQLV